MEKHNDTFRREKIVEIVAGLGLEEMRIHDLFELSQNHHKPDILSQINPITDCYIKRANGYPELQARGEELRQRLNEIGFDGASSLLVIGRKAEQIQGGRA